MLLLTVAPWPSACALDSTILSTDLDARVGAAEVDILQTFVFEIEVESSAVLYWTSPRSRGALRSAALATALDMRCVVRGKRNCVAKHQAQSPWTWYPRNVPGMFLEDALGPAVGKMRAVGCRMDRL